MALLESLERSLRSPRPVLEDVYIARDSSIDLLRLADEKILSFPYKDVPTCWRRLYTDASILKVVSRLVIHRVTGGQGTEVSGDNNEGWSGCIRDLDMALIVAGAPGNNRKEMIFDLMRDVQVRFLTHPRHHSLVEDDADAERPSKRLKTSSHTKKSTDTIPRPHSQPILRPVPSVSEPPSLSSFLRNHTTRPFIVRKGVKSWPAISDPSRSWKDPVYLEKVAGPARVVPVEVGGNYTEEGWGQKVMGWDEFLEGIGMRTAGTGEKDHGSGGRDGGSPLLYLAQHDLFHQFPSLLADILSPDILFSFPPVPDNYPSYKPPDTEDGVIRNAWLGPRGTKSPAHTDPYFNCYGELTKPCRSPLPALQVASSWAESFMVSFPKAQVVGRKYIWLAPPECSQFMYPFGGDDPDAGEMEGTAVHLSASEDDDDDDDETNNVASSYMTNTSRVDVFAAVRAQSNPSSPPTSVVNDSDRGEAESVMKDKFPRFFSEVIPRSMQAVLEEGDLLFMPPG